jgi:hypothetical protein
MVTVGSVEYVVDKSSVPATLFRSGSLTGAVPDGLHVWVVDKPLRTSHDSTPERNPGNDRVYPVAELYPEKGPCWTVKSGVGYEEALGITFRDYVVLVDDSTSARFANVNLWQATDGFEPNELNAVDAGVVASYDIPTTP